MRAWLGIALLGLQTAPVSAASTPRQDALIAGYFAIWDDDAQVTPDNVRKLYASRLIYYGHPMTREDLYRDKLAFIHRWPGRRYGIEPGSASRSCDAGGNRCTITATLLWRTSGVSGTRSGRSRVTLTLARDEGALKIVRESGVTLRR